jgi:Domain of unknown function (DUF6597)
MHVVVRPSPILVRFVESLWYVENYGQGWERVLPSGGTQLLVNLCTDELWSWDDTCRRSTMRVHGAALEGPRSAPILIDTAQLRAMIGVAFRPGGTHPVFTPPASVAAGGLVELAELWGRPGELLRERLLPPVPASAGRDVRRESHRLGAVGSRMRLLRPGPHDPRLPRALGDQPEVLHSTIRTRAQPRAALAVR